MSHGGAPRRNPVAAWLNAHRRAALDGWRHLSDHCLAAVLSIGVLAVAVSLPGLLYGLLERHEAVSARWRVAPALTAFMHASVSLEDTHRLAGQWRGDPATRAVQVHPAAEAYRELLDAAGLGISARPAAAGDNPLPHVVALTPAPMDAAARERLAARVREDPRVEAVLIDADWSQRLGAIERLAARFLLLVTLVLAGGALLIVTNAIRVQLQQRRDELLVLRMVGATDAYIRRPFLYSGLVHGLGAGALAIAVIVAVFASLSEAADTLALAYGSDFRLGLPAPAVLAAVFFGSLVTGWLGAWLGAAAALRRLHGTTITA